MTAKLDSHDRRPDLRGFIHEAMGFAAIHAGLAQTYAELGDDVGLAYALRRFAAYARAATSTFNDLVAAERQLEAEQHDAAA